MGKRLKIYFNGDCSKCRGTLELVAKAGFEAELVHYLDTPPSEAELDALLKMLGKEPHEIVRKGEDEYTQLGLDRSPPATRAEWIRMLVQNPVLIERPIVTDGKRAVIARPPERVRELTER